MPLLNAIREVYPGLRAVYDLQDRCIGVVVKSRKYPFRFVFFCFDNSELYYGYDPLGAVLMRFIGGEQ